MITFLHKKMFLILTDPDSKFFQEL